MNIKCVNWIVASVALCITVLCITVSLSACGGGGGGSDNGGGGGGTGGGGGGTQGDLIISAVGPTHGPAGTLVTLTGSGFSTVLSENVVTLNNKPCTISAATATELTVIVPAQAGSGNLQVSVLAKTAQSPTFTYDLSFVTVSTFAGAQTGFLNGVGTAARFSSPVGIAFDTAGTLFVADASNQRIRAVSAAGSVGTFAGSGVQGTVNAPGEGAQFNFPVGVAFDSSGNLFVSEVGANIIRKIFPSGDVGTFVDAGLNSPMGLAFDQAGNLYVADHFSHRILKVDSSGAVTTFAGSGTRGSADGTGSAAQFNFPSGVAICGDGNMFVADTNNMTIRKITPAGVVTKYAGGNPISFTDGSLLEAGFLFPVDLACDAEGKLFVADSVNHAIRMITPSGVVTTLAGSPLHQGFADGDGASAGFSLPSAIAIGADGSLLISDSANSRIRKLVWQ